MCVGYVMEYFVNQVDVKFGGVFYLYLVSCGVGYYDQWVWVFVGMVECVGDLVQVVVVVLGLVILDDGGGVGLVERVV